MKRTILSPEASPLLPSIVIMVIAVLVVILFLAAMSALPASGQETPPVNFVSGQLYSGVGFGDRIPGAANVYTFAVADFNLDGNLDLITNNDSNLWGIGLVLGNGDGSFQPPTKVVGNDSYGDYGGIVAGTFNGDTYPDFAVLSLVGTGPVQLSVYLNDGSGHFALQSSYAFGDATLHFSRSLATADVNGDGKLDLIAPDFSTLSVAVFYGHGDGTFPNSTEFSASVLGKTTPTGVAVGDFNQDGKPDIVTASVRAGITVLLNQSNGAFAAPVQYDNPKAADNALVALADLNGDGLLDVAESSEGGNVGVFLGNGDGTFQTCRNFTVPWASAIAIGDLNGDRKPDIVATSYPDGSVWVLLNRGSGNFQISSVYSADSSAMAMQTGMWVALADLNDDNQLDFITGNPAGQFVTVALGNGDGAFHDSPHYNESPGIWANHMAVADFNLDGNLDLVEAGGGTGVGLSVMLGNSHGIFQAPTSIDLSAHANGAVTFVRAADVNRDGKPDIICVNHKGAVVLMGLGTGQFAEPVTYPSGSSYPAVVWPADLNGDRALDLVTSNYDGTMSALLNNGIGGFGTATVFPSGTGAYASQFVLGDFNSDGRQDIAIADYPGARLYTLTGNGDGTFQSPILLSTPIRPRAIVAGDFNQDGAADLAIAGSDYSGSLAVLLGDGNGTFTAATYEWFDDSGCNPLACPHYPWSIIAVDLNADDNLDLAIAPGNPWYLTCGGYRCAELYLGAVVYLGKGDGSFVEQFGWLAGISPWVVEAGDFNRDGMRDLAFLSTDTNYGSTSVAILQNATQPLSISPLSLDFWGGKHVETVVLTNNQSTKLNIQSITLSGRNASDFTLQRNCGTSLGAGLHCTITVTFRPYWSHLPRTAFLVITDDLGTQTVPLTWEPKWSATPAAATMSLPKTSSRP
jgi:hypothetical protein